MLENGELLLAQTDLYRIKYITVPRRFVILNNVQFMQFY